MALCCEEQLRYARSNEPHCCHEAHTCSTLNKFPEQKRRRLIIVEKLVAASGTGTGGEVMLDHDRNQTRC